MRSTSIKDILYRIRRNILKKIVPEFIWPEYIIMDGANIPVKGKPFSFGIKRILSKGIYEDSERSLIREIIKKGDQVIEFGGSIGIMAAIMNEIVSREGIIISVEASKALTDYSRSWLGSKGNIQILTGIGYPVWEAPIKYHNIQFIDDGNSLGGRVDFNVENDKLNEGFEIYDLKRITSTYPIRPDHLLIDIEGSEIIFLEEGIEIPDSVQNMVIEMHPNLYGQETENEIIKKLAYLGFFVHKEIRHVFLLSRNEKVISTDV